MYSMWHTGCVYRTYDQWDLRKLWRLVRFVIGIRSNVEQSSQGLIEDIVCSLLHLQCCKFQEGTEWFLAVLDGKYKITSSPSIHELKKSIYSTRHIIILGINSSHCCAPYLESTSDRAWQSPLSKQPQLYDMARTAAARVSPLISMCLLSACPTCLVL